MNLKKEHYILALIFLITLGTRLYFAFSTEYFAYDSYFNLRQIENIKEKGLPIFDDKLSYSGRYLIFMPFFHYVLAFFDLFLPIDFVAKVIPNMFASLLVVIVFYVTKKITEDKEAALFASFVSGFIPIFFIETIINVSSYTLLFPLILLLIYFFIKVKDDEKYIKYFILVLLIATFTSSSVFLLIVALVIYVGIGKLEHLKIRRNELELITFSTLMVVLVLYLVYRQALMLHGPSVIWQNIPKNIMIKYFKEVSFLEAIYKIGLVPFFSGLYITYRSFFKERRKYNLMLVSFVIAIALMLWFKLVSLVNGIVFLGIMAILLFANFYKLLFNYIKKTKAAILKKFFVFFLFVIIIITSIIPSLYYVSLKIETAPTAVEVKALEWLRENTNEEDIILTPVKEGFIINYIAKRKNILDSNFILISDVAQRVEDVETIYTTQFKTNAIELLNKYNIKYIYLSDRIREDFAVDELRYYDEGCFDVVYYEGVTIYKSLCRLEE